MKNQELEVIVKESGLELSESESIKQSYLPNFEQMATVKEESKKINFENPTMMDLTNFSLGGFHPFSTRLNRLEEIPEAVERASPDKRWDFRSLLKIRPGCFFVFIF